MIYEPIQGTVGGGGGISYHTASSRLTQARKAFYSLACVASVFVGLIFGRAKIGKKVRRGSALAPIFEQPQKAKNASTAWNGLQKRLLLRLFTAKQKMDQYNF